MDLAELKQKFSDKWLEVCVKAYEIAPEKAGKFIYSLSAAVALANLFSPTTIIKGETFVALLNTLGLQSFSKKLAGKDEDIAALQRTIAELQEIILQKDFIDSAPSVQAILQSNAQLNELMREILDRLDAKQLALQKLQQRSSDHNLIQLFEKAWQEGAEEVVVKIKRDRTPELLQTYLQKLVNECESLPLAALAEEEDPHVSSKITLSRLYVQLNTRNKVNAGTGEPLTDRDAKIFLEDFDGDKIRPMKVLEAANFYDQLVVLGNAGSGKTSFVNYLLMKLALHHQDPKKNPEPDGWKHGALFPIRVVLRELLQSFPAGEKKNLQNLPARQKTAKLSSIVLEHICRSSFEDHEEQQSFQKCIKEQFLLQGKCLIVFDGLDEVSARYRSLLRDAIHAFEDAYKNNRIMVTCRIRSYGGNAVLGGYKAVTLAPFDDKQVETFIDHWYDTLAETQTSKFSPKTAKKKAKRLKKAVKRLPPDMVTNPLLLTVIAIVDANNIELPKKRVQLYDRAAEILLKRWREHKVGKISLFEELGLKNENPIYHALWELGFKAQQLQLKSEARQRQPGSDDGDSTANIPFTEAIEILARNFREVAEPAVAAARFLEYIDQSAGLLVGKGGTDSNVYAFAHRTFQEYFAACYLLKATDDCAGALRQLLSEGVYWQLTAELTLEALLYNEKSPARARRLAWDLCGVREPEQKDPAIWRGVYWAALFGEEIGFEYFDPEKQPEIPTDHRDYLQRLAERLGNILENGYLETQEHIHIGYLLSKLGDPRPGVCTLPPAWVALPGGKFMMGDDSSDEDDEKPAHPVRLSPFKISKYPITNAQFRRFVEEGGYREKRWWSPEGWKEKEEGGWQAPRYWDDADFNLANQPVVGVSWYEAEAFCNWLTDWLRRHGHIGPDEIVALPTEAQWEYAARGIKGRQYPWGDDHLTPDHANYDESHIGRTTAVGCYARGATPEGVFDLAGNAWEWCLDVYDGDFYKKCKKKGTVTDPVCLRETGRRVLRGGSWGVHGLGLRAAFRVNGVPRGGGYVRGFRVVLRGES